MRQIRRVGGSGCRGSHRVASCKDSTSAHVGQPHACWSPHRTASGPPGRTSCVQGAAPPASVSPAGRGSGGDSGLAEDAKRRISPSERGGHAVTQPSRPAGCTSVALDRPEEEVQKGTPAQSSGRHTPQQRAELQDGRWGRGAQHTAHTASQAGPGLHGSSEEMASLGSLLKMQNLAPGIRICLLTRSLGDEVAGGFQTRVRRSAPHCTNMRMQSARPDGNRAGPRWRQQRLSKPYTPAWLEGTPAHGNAGQFRGPDHLQGLGYRCLEFPSPAAET